MHACIMHVDIEDAALLEFCKKHALFHEHPIEQLELLVTKMVPLKMDTGDVLCHAGDQGSDLFLLLVWLCTHMHVRSCPSF